MSELEECPFCGGEAVMVGQRKKGRTRDVVNAFARCKSCGARSKNVSTLHVAERNLETYAARAWNARWERTCHAVGKDCKPYDPDPEHSLLDAECDQRAECGAKVVER